ncbi:uncharacterized protein DDB_G0286591 isoform X1 [Stomoxys calcitrans]|uniref:uncharacterized protein DDB_G0286591 isoform X1 n=2 Tax=Stomoxys calcitrans TaxID=35570 RepID=UPI0027E2D838|nr:uncharacterized protein DDB_G0286591 isoform X1 [Stomoxys calcitrans]XP_059225102.1 uncharacterized protein DDB_G0286591 isoform X1 [Stomoxys calcitrans]
MVNSNKPPKMKVKQQQQEGDNAATTSETTHIEKASNNSNSNTSNSSTPNEAGQKTQNATIEPQQQTQKTNNKTPNSPQQKTKNNNSNSPKSRNNNNQNNNSKNKSSQQQQQAQKNSGQKSQKNKQKQQQQQNGNTENDAPKSGKYVKSTSYRNSAHSYAQTVGSSSNSKKTYNKPQPLAAFNDNLPLPRHKGKQSKQSSQKGGGGGDGVATNENSNSNKQMNLSSADLLTAALTKPCAKCLKPTSAAISELMEQSSSSLGSTSSKATNNFNPKHYRKSKSYMNSSRYSSNGDLTQKSYGSSSASSSNGSNSGNRHQYHRSQSDRRNSFDRHFAERNKNFVPIEAPARPILASSNIAAVIADTEKMVIIERLGKGRTTYPIMQCGTLDAPDSSYHTQRSNRMDVYQIDDGFHSDGGTETPPPSPSSGSSIASTSDHGSLESVDTGGTQRLAVLSFEQVRKLHHVMDEKVAIHGRGNFPTLEVTLKDLVNLVRRKLEADVGSGGAGVIVKDIRLNGGAASHVLASEDQSYNDLDLIYAIELSSPRHFDRVKTAVLNTLLDLLPEGVSKRRIMPCALKEAYVGKMVKVNNNNDGDRWSLISLGNSPGHKNVELKFVDTMRRQFEFSVDSFQIVLDSLLLFYDCAALPISENFYPTVVGESVYGDFQEALYHLQKKLISTRQPEEIRGGGLLKYCNLLVHGYSPVDSQLIKAYERYMCSRFFIDFPDINTQTVKLEAYLRNHFWGVDEEPLQYQYLMHLREVVENSTVCLMGHERRQTLMLIQTLAAQVLYKEQQKQVQEHQQYQQQQQQQQQQQGVTEQQQQQQQQHQSQQQPHTVQATTMTLVAATPPQNQHQHHHHQQQQQQQHPHHQQQQQLSSPQQQQQQQQQAIVQPQTTTIYVQQVPQTTPQNVTTTATICCAMPTAAVAAAAPLDPTQQQQQQTSAQAQQQQQQPTTASATAVPQTIQIQAGPPGLIYANGYYYAPVIPTTICTCNSTWLST